MVDPRQVDVGLVWVEDRLPSYWDRWKWGRVVQKEDQRRVPVQTKDRLLSLRGKRCVGPPFHHPPTGHQPP